MKSIADDHNLKYYETSSKTGEGVKELFASMILNGGILIFSFKFEICSEGKSC